MKSISLPQLTIGQQSNVRRAEQLFFFLIQLAGAGQEETFAQDAGTLALGHASEGGHHRRTYRLDGTETKSVLQSHGEDIVTTSRAAWEGATLVIHETTRYPDNRTLEARRTLSLDPDGQLLRTFTGRMNGEALPEMKTVSRKR